MTSSLTNRGSTRAWRTIRQAYADHLAAVGAVPCWRWVEAMAGHPVDRSPHCTRVIRDGDRWHLGHKTDRALGGTDTDLGYECQPCSNHTGGKLAARLRRATRRPSRRW